MELPALSEMSGEIGALGVGLVAAAVGLLVHWLVWRLLEGAAQRTPGTADLSVLRHTENAARAGFVVLAIYLGLAMMEPDVRATVRGIVLFVGILIAGWVVVGLLRAASEVILARLPADDEDEGLLERQRRTQLLVLERFGTIIIWLVTVALALLTIPGVAPLAASLLAGAGVIGIVLGVAAGPTIGNFIAGVQIALTQPLKVGDVVVIDGQSGTVGEITSTYVVLYIWDKRRLIVPLTKVVNEPVENWTRRTRDLLGAVKLYLDYRAPVDAIREEYKRVLDESGLWDGEHWSVLVTDSGERTMTVRLAYSAPDAAVEWSLRCLVRERLIAFLQAAHPYALPVVREQQVEEGPARPA